MSNRNYGHYWDCSLMNYQNFVYEHNGFCEYTYMYTNIWKSFVCSTYYFNNYVCCDCFHIFQLENGYVCNIIIFYTDNINSATPFEYSKHYVDKT